MTFEHDVEGVVALVLDDQPLALGNPVSDALLDQPFDIVIVELTENEEDFLHDVLLGSGVVAFYSAPTIAGPEFKLNFGTMAPEGTPWAELLSRVEKQVEADSGGQINVIIRPPGLMAEVEVPELHPLVSIADTT